MAIASGGREDCSYIADQHSFLDTTNASYSSTEGAGTLPMTQSFPNTEIRLSLGDSGL